LILHHCAWRNALYDFSHNHFWEKEFALQDIADIRRLEQILQREMALFGYKLMEVPMIEEAEIFLTRAGDSIIERLFTFERFGRLLALRPEFTAAVAHYYSQAELADAVRWQLSGLIFEDEPSDISRQYEKHTIGAEFLGQSGIAADAEIIAMAAKGIEKLNISNWQLVLGHVGLLRYLLNRFGLDSRAERLLLAQRDTLRREGKEAALANLQNVISLPTENIPQVPDSGSSGQTQYMLDVLLDSTRYGTTMGGRSRHEIAQRLLKKRERALELEQFVAAIGFLEAWSKLSGTASEIFPIIAESCDDKGLALLDDWKKTIALLEAYGIPQERIIIQPDLSKNWDYYTGLVFGLRQGETVLASGGRYDGLTQLFGAESVPAVGFVYYSQALLNSQNTEASSKIYSLNADNEKNAIAWASALREKGISVALSTNGAEITCKAEFATYQGREYRLEALAEVLA
jgi:histidyl-tRNA synthetase